MPTSYDSAFFTRPGAHIHVVGIGGAGMSAIARLLFESGIEVSGSDRQSNDMTRALQRDGVTVYEGHAADHIRGATVLLVSSAVKDDNPEVAAARAAGIPVLNRREALPCLLPGKTQIAVAGTHGKTTTTALIAYLLLETGDDPSYVVGGILNNTGQNAHVGQGGAFVVEADEYDNMFLGLSPQIAVITNIEHDHPDIFPTLDDVLSAFRQFVARLPEEGTLIACIDDPYAYQLAHERRAAGKPVITYGLGNPNADWSAIDLIDDVDQTSFTIRYFQRGYALRQPAILTLAGRHNIQNALAALAAVNSYGVALDVSIPHLKMFQGTGRRFEVMGQAGGVVVLSDYGHHPTAIRATLQAARQRYGQTTIWAVWQPHTYSRMRLLAADFAKAFSDANYLFITDIYAARETRQAGDPTAADLARLAASAGHGDPRYSGDLDSTAAILAGEVSPGDVVIIFSAGDAPKIGEMLLDSLSKR
jgi:UDP-N-acetylmuramate--alanine ligase